MHISLLLDTSLELKSEPSLHSGFGLGWSQLLDFGLEAGLNYYHLILSLWIRNSLAESSYLQVSQHQSRLKSRHELCTVQGGGVE